MSYIGIFKSHFFYTSVHELKFNNMLEGQDLKLGMINVFRTKSVELEKLPV